MKFQSMTTFKEKLPYYRRQYAAMRGRKARTRFLDHLVASLRIDRKYLIKLLRGKRLYRPHRGRSPAYSQGAKGLIATLWRAAGMPCAEYLKPMLPKLAADYAELGDAPHPEDLGQALKMSASTIGRAVRALHAPRGAKRNRRSGLNALKKDIPEMPGSQLPEDRPGACQIDSVALCGGNMAESFFYVATLTDAATQWFECAPSWNRGDKATSRAMRTIHARLPFALLHAHPDNGGEFINHLFVRQLKELAPGVRISRSRPYRKNDNCRIEQKNGSVIRDYFGDIRLDRHGHYAALDAVCADIALYTNLFRPCKKLVSKERKECKGVKYIRRYDAPRTPLERLGAFLPADDPRLLSCRKQCASLNSVTLLRSIHTQLRRLVRGLSAPAGAESPSTALKSRTRSVSAQLTDAPAN